MLDWPLKEARLPQIARERIAMAVPGRKIGRFGKKARIDGAMKRRMRVEGESYSVGTAPGNAITQKKCCTAWPTNLQVGIFSDMALAEFHRIDG
jgi:hypothetical protein